MNRIKQLEELAKKADGKLDRDLFNFYKEALRKLKKETKDHVKKMETLAYPEQLILNGKLRKTETVDKILTDLLRKADINVKDFVRNEAINGFLGTMYDIEGKASINLSFNMINQRYIDTLVNKKTVGKNLSERLYKHSETLSKAVKKELMDGAISGEGYRKIAKRIEESTEATYKQSLNIARTEGKRVQTETTQLGYEEAEELGVELQKQWKASLDDRTRENHQDLDGQTVDVDEYFEIGGYSGMGPGDFGDPAMNCNCRCTTISVVNGIAPRLRRDNITKEIIENQTYNEWKISKGV